MRLACPTKCIAFSIDVFQGIAEIHDAFRMRTVAKAEGMAQFMYCFLDGTLPEGRVIGSDLQAIQGYDRRLSVKVSDAEHKVQISRIQVQIRDGQDPDIIASTAGSMKKRVRFILPPSGVKRTGRDLCLLKKVRLNSEQPEVFHEPIEITLFCALKREDSKPKIHSLGLSVP